MDAASPVATASLPHGCRARQREIDELIDTVEGIQTADTTGDILKITAYQKFSYLLLFKGKKMDSNNDGYLNPQEIYSYEKSNINKIIGAGSQTPKIYAGKMMGKNDNIFKVLTVH